MSAEEDTELRDLVAKTLENNGVLAKIRAELRASVFLALEEQESSSPSFENKALKEYLKTQQAALGLCIVREFLEYLELDFTLSVYNTETSHGKGYEYSGRNKLMKDLQIQGLNGKKGPLLAHILQIAQESKGLHTVSKEQDTSYIISNSKIPAGGSPQQNVSHDLGTSLDSSNVSVAPLDRTFTSDGTTVKGILQSSNYSDDIKTKASQLKQPPTSPEALPNDDGKQEIKSSLSLTKSNAQENLKKTSVSNENCNSSNLVSKSKRNDGTSDRKENSDGESSQNRAVKKEVKNPMSSLNDLPPIGDLQGRKFFNKASINLSDLGFQDDYEEDFVSTDSSAAALDEKSKSQSQKSSPKETSKKRGVSGDTKPSNGSHEKDLSDKTGNSPVGSISEDLDDNTNSGIDELLNSAASTENTVDNTISHIQSNFADYIEDL